MTVPLVFESLHIENFGGYYGESHARFPSGDRNIMLVRGRNTGGKTSFINAIKWCLYGVVETRSDSTLGLAQLFNTVAAGEGEDTMRVTLDAKIRGEPYVIVREARRRFPNTQATSDNDYTTSFEVKKDGQILSEERSVKLINRIAPRIISRFFLFDGELLKEYEDLVEKRSRGSTYPLVEAIEDVLGLPALQTASKSLAKALSHADKNVSRTAQSNTQTKNLSHQLEQKRMQRDQNAEEHQSIEQRLEDLQTEKAGLEKEVSKERAIDRLRGKMDHNRAEKIRVDREIGDLHLTLQTLSGEAWKDGIFMALQQRKDLTESEYETLSHQQEDHLINEHDLQTLKAIAESGHCNVCDQDVEQSSLRSIQSKIDAIVETQASRQAQHEAVREKSFQIKQIRMLEGKVRPVCERYESTQERLFGLINDHARLQEDHDRMEAEAKNENLDAIRRRRENLEHIIQEIGHLTGKVNELSERIAGLDRDIEHLVDQIHNKQASKEVEAATRAKQKLEKLKRVFEQGRKQLREEMRAHVQDYASRAYKAMIHEPDHEGVQISPDSYALSIVDKRGRAVTEPSAGDTQVLALALIVALGKAGRPIGPIVMDTPFGRLDEDHRGRVLRYLTRQTNQLVLLYHSGELQPSTLNNVQSRVGCSYEIEKRHEGRSILREGTA